ncbi:MAG: tetratricopeptide repeat protein [Desulforegulaceae bacterium]|nr:tetratricopeptide repeat protein [Desulforegulaceae bacterium]
MKKLLLILIIVLSAPLFAESAVIREISLENSGEKIVIGLDQYPNFRVYQSDKNEVIISFKDTDLHENIITSGRGGDFISKIFYEEFLESISIVTIITKKEIEDINKSFDYARNRLIVNFIPKRVYYSNKSPVYIQKKQLDKSMADKLQSGDKKHFKSFESGKDKKTDKFVKQEDRIIKTIPGEKVYSKTSSVGNIVDAMEKSPCRDSINVKTALRLAKEKNFQAALGRMEAELKGGFIFECEDKLVFLKSWLEYMVVKSDQDNNSLYALKNQVESLLLRYQDSSFIPYGYALAGLINKDLANYPLSKGFFHLAEQGYPDYQGMAEVYFNLGEIYYEEKELRKSEEYLEKLEKEYSDTKFNDDAKLIYGQILYSRKRYFDTIRTLGPFVNENSRVIYESPDLLKFVADSYFLTGSNEKARELFSQIFNMFPEMDKKDIVLASIGETFENQGDLKKAENIYKLVIERYPGTEGFIKSSLKLADNMDDPEKREIIYKMIVKDFPDSVEGRISLLRLATIYNDQQRFEESIDSIKILLRENPRALRKDALHLMGVAMGGLLENYIENDNYAAALRLVEKNRFFIEDMKNYKVHFISGKVYNETHMYGESKERLGLAYKLFPNKAKIPFELLEYMVLTDIELKNYDEALGVCDEILKKFNDGGLKGFAYEKKADISAALNDFDKSESFYKNSISVFNDKLSKASVFVKLGELYKSENKNLESINSFDRAVSIYSSLGKNDYKNQIAYSAKKSGEINLKLKRFEKAVSSFKIVLDFNAGKENFYEAKFSMGEALRGSGKIEDALKEYRAVFLAEESGLLFKKLAEQRIREIELEKTLEKS